MTLTEAGTGCGRYPQQWTRLLRTVRVQGRPKGITTQQPRPEGFGLLATKRESFRQAQVATKNQHIPAEVHRRQDRVPYLYVQV